jgi:hypothetical protein
MQAAQLQAGSVGPNVPELQQAQVSAEQEPLPVR